MGKKNSDEATTDGAAPDNTSGPETSGASELDKNTDATESDSIIAAAQVTTSRRLDHTVRGGKYMNREGKFVNANGEEL